MLSTMAKYSDNSLVVVSSDMKYRKKYMNLKSRIGSVMKLSRTTLHQTFR